MCVVPRARCCEGRLLRTGKLTVVSGDQTDGSVFVKEGGGRRAVGSFEPRGAGAAGNDRRRRRDDWRLGGRSVRPWNTFVLSAAFLGAGIGLIVSVALSRVAFGGGVAASTVGLWSGLLLATIYAFRRSRPRRLLLFRPMDILWAIGLSAVLRISQGWLSAANTMVFPVISADLGSFRGGVFLSTAFSTAIAGPLIEEFFFRGVVLISIYQLLRRSVGVIAAGVTAVLGSSAAFVALHLAFSELSLADAVQLFGLGAVAAVLVLLTGRIWAAVLTHVLYNGVYVLLVFMGTILR